MDPLVNAFSHRGGVSPTGRQAGRQMLVSVIAAVLMLASLNTQAGSLTTQESVQVLLDKVYQPFHQDFNSTAQQFSAAAEQACEQPSTASVAQLQAQFAQLVGSFSRIELFRLGPLLQENRQNRLFYWPDKRRVGERQMRSLLISDDVSTLTLDELSGKSVALQGLPAMERLLFSPALSEALASSPHSALCSVLTLVAANIATMANELERHWHSETRFVQNLLNPSSDSDYYRSEQEVLRALLTHIAVGLEVVLERKLKAVIESEPASVRKAPLWLSGQWLNMVEQNLASLEALVLDSGLAARAQIDNELAFEFRSARGMLHKLQALPERVNEQRELTPDTVSLVRSLSAVVGGIAYTVGDRLAASLGVSAGFNSEDGD